MSVVVHWLLTPLNIVLLHLCPRYTGVLISP